MTTAMPKIGNAKKFSGEVRRDFREIGEGKCGPEKRLDLLLKHSGYPISDSERAEAIEVLRQLNPVRWVNGNPVPVQHQSMNVYTITYQLETRPALKPFAIAIRAGFEFQDRREDVRWSLVYALIAKTLDGQVIAELGQTEKPADEVLLKLRKPSPTARNTRLRRFLADATASNIPCYLLQLECCMGSLDDADLIKDRWKLAGIKQSVRFPGRPYVMEFVHEDQTRDWPPFEDAIQQSVRL